MTEPERLHARERPHAALLAGVLHLLRRFVQMQVHRQVEVVGEHANARESFVGNRVRRMRRQRRRDQRFALELVADGEVLVEVFIASSGPGTGKLDEWQADRGAEAMAQISCRLHVREEIVFAATGRTAAQHFGDRKLDAIAHELRPHDLGFGRPDVMLQPRHQRQIVGQAAHQRHRIVRVRVDEPGDQRVRRKIDAPCIDVLRSRRVDRQDIDNRITGDRHGMMIEYAAVRFDWDDPAGFEDGVDDGLSAYRRESRS